MSAPTSSERAEPYIYWFVGSRPRSVRLQYRNYTKGAIVHWGDGLDEVCLPGMSLSHDYDKPGAYMVRVQESGPGKFLDHAQIVVQDALAPVVTWGPAPDNPGIYRCTFGDPGNGIVPRYWIDWGDGSDAEEHWGVPGQYAEHVLEPGLYHITIKDLSTKLFDWRQHTIEGLSFDPAFTLSADTSDTTGMTVTLKITKAVLKPMTIDWGDRSSTNVQGPEVGATITHQYPFPDQFLVTAAYNDGTGNPYSDIANVPFPQQESRDE